MIRKALLWVLVLTIAALVVLAFRFFSFDDSSPPPETIKDHWYGLTIAGAKSGWMHNTVQQDGSLIRTTSEQQLELSRGGMVIEIAVKTAFVETTDGKPVSVHTTQEAMGQVSESTWKFTATEIEMTSVAGGLPITKKLPLPTETWMTPRVVDNYFKEQMQKGAAAISYQTMSPELGTKIITVIMTKLGSDTLSVMGENRKVTTWQTENDAMPIKGVDTYDADGVKVVTAINAGFGNMENILMSEQAAQSPVGQVPEVMFSLFIEPSKEIPVGTAIRNIKMIAKTKDNTPMVLPTCGFQSATANSDGSCTVVVDLLKPAPATSAELADSQYLEKTALCDGTDSAVVALAKEAVKNLPAKATELEKAEAMREFVYKYITGKGYGNAFASASQVARDPSGDCTEHGVLLCALLRASGIPSRGVMGIVYISPQLMDVGKPNGVFGWHFWSQALIDGKWIDLDSTLVVPYTVGHIASVTSGLATESMHADMVAIMALIGNTEVEVVEMGK